MVGSDPAESFQTCHTRELPASHAFVSSQLTPAPWTFCRGAP